MSLNEFVYQDNCPPRKVQEIQEQLLDLEELKSLVKQAGIRDAANEFRLTSILNTESHLLEELHAAKLMESTDDFELSLDGDPVQDHTVATDFLGRLLIDFQDLVNLISNEVNNNSSVREKTLSKNDESGKIMITGWGSSSFIIRMKLPCSEAQENHPSDDRKRRLLACLEAMFSDDIPEDQLADLIDGHGVKKAYKKLLGNVASQKAIIKLRTKSNPYGNKLTFPRAKERIKRIDELAKESTNIELTGQLVGGSLESKKFQLKVGEKIYSGNVTLDAHQQMKGFRFGDTVHAIVEETRKYAKRSKNTITLTYKLDSIFRVENNSPDENRSV